jgi:hypothetical protein
VPTVRRTYGPDVDQYVVGFRVAAMEIAAGTASFAGAAERGLFVGDRTRQSEWDSGYGDCVCAHRLGHDVSRMASAGLFAPSVVPTAEVVSGLLDGTWGEEVRPDPRR